jgi:hypothetical protein
MKNINMKRALAILLTYSMDELEKTDYSPITKLGIFLTSDSDPSRQMHIRHGEGPRALFSVRTTRVRGEGLRIGHYMEFFAHKTMSRGGEDSDIPGLKMPLTK